MQSLRALIRLDYLRVLTDTTGVLQFGLYGVPDPHSGYTLDDNARALIVATLASMQGIPAAEPLARRYLGFLRYAQRPDGSVHNLFDYRRQPIPGGESQDSLGRFAWALGTVVSSTLPEGIRLAARELFWRALPWLERLDYPRSCAFALLGVIRLLPYEPQLLEPLLHQLAHRLVRLYQENADREWRWFEPLLTYANGSLCEALLQAALCTGSTLYAEIALEALEFLNHICSIDGVIAPVGNRGWYRRGGIRALFAQQPIDTFWLCWANWSAWRFSRDSLYLRTAQACVRWFLGENLLGLPLYDPLTGACHDGLEAEGVNGNCGAESTLCALLTLLRSADEEAQLQPLARPHHTSATTTATA